MSKHKHDCVSDVQLEGRFLGFAAKDGYKLKYLRLATAKGEYTIKIAEELRRTLWRTLVPGEWIHVSGYQKQNEQGMVKFKAYQVVVATPNAPGAGALSPATSVVERAAEQATAKACILVCQKSDCCNRGGLAVSEALRVALRDRHLTHEITVKATGCMKQCKAGPNIVMPDKTRYSGIRPDAIPALIDKHFQPAPVA